MLPSETMIWQPEFTDKTLSRKPGAVHIAIAVSATRMDGQGSVIMSGTLKYCFAYIVILGLKVGLVYHLFMA